MWWVNKSVNKRFQVLLYYKYVPIENHEEFAKRHLEFCLQLGLRGRILVAPEGMNGTVSGTYRQTQEYMHALQADSRFHDMVFKIDEIRGHVFKKMFVRAKREIVHLGLTEDIQPQKLTGHYLTPKDFYRALQEKNVVVIDGRNDYEYDIGHFRGAIRPDVKSFREFPEWIRKHKQQFVGKKVLTYCTGGIRCEKLSGLLLREGLRDVYQLQGGIVTYSKDPDVQGRLFDGKCYVFDERISIRVNQTEEDVIVGKCIHCANPSDRYVNCGNLDCHKQHICCETCDRIYDGFCQISCKDDAIRNHRVDPLNEYRLQHS